MKQTIKPAKGGPFFFERGWTALMMRVCQDRKSKKPSLKWREKSFSSDRADPVLVCLTKQLSFSTGLRIFSPGPPQLKSNPTLYSYFFYIYTVYIFKQKSYRRHPVGL